MFRMCSQNREKASGLIISSVSMFEVVVQMRSWWPLCAQMQALYAPGGSPISGQCINIVDTADLLNEPDNPHSVR
jgi:hypothetical protein